MNKITACLLLILLMLILPGCSLIEIPQPVPSDDGSINNSPSKPIAGKGGLLTVPIPTPDTFNPLLTQSRDMLNFLSLIYEGTVTYDKNSHPIPALASSWEVSPDERLWIFNIKKGIKWHNGESFTGEDILFTFKALQSGILGSFYQKNIFENVNIVEAGLKNGDPYTFFIRLAEPSSNVLDLMTFPVLPKSVYQSVESMMNGISDFSTLPIGTGPYRIDPNHPYNGESIKLVRNDSWWAEKEPYIDAILAKVYTTNEEARNAFNNGEIDIVDTMVVYANTYSDFDNTTQYKYLTQNYEFLALNNSNSLFKDKNVRKAIAYAIDRKDIISKVYLNNAETVDVPIPSSSWLYDSNYRIYDYNVEQASKLLKDAGWLDSDGDGTLDKIVNGQKIDLTFTILTNSDNDFRRDAVNLIANHLGLVGFKVQVEVVGWEQLLNENMINHQFDAILTGYNLDYIHDLRFAFHSREIGIGNNNFIGYSNGELDSLLDAAARTYADDKRKEIYRGIQEHLVEELPVISLYFRTGTLLVNEKVHGIERIGEMSIYRDIENWFITK